jgi:hypothetical protein
MPVQDILSEINAIPKVAGSAVFSSTGILVAKRISYPAIEEEKDSLYRQMTELIPKVSADKEGFAVEAVPGKPKKILADRFHHLVAITLLNPGADTYLVKLHLDLALRKLHEDKEVVKILNREFILPIAMWKKVSNWDVVKYNEYLVREGLKKGIVITKTPYDEKVREELSKPGNRVEIVIEENMKDEFSRMKDKFEALGYIVKKAEGITDRWL